MNKMIEKQISFLRESTITFAIIFINIVVYIILNTIPESREILLLNPEPDLIKLRPWTLVTVFFSQEVHVHLLLNMGLFFVFGRELEKKSGSSAVFWGYALCGLLGSLTIPFLAPFISWSGLVAGASAAVWGVVAMLAVLDPERRFRGYTAKHYTIGLFCGNLALFIMNPEISIGAAAHFAGIFTGLAVGYLFKRRLKMI